MAAYVGVLVSDPWLQNQFTQVELRTLKSSVSVDSLLLRCFFFHFRFSSVRFPVVHSDEEGERRSFEAGGPAGEDVQAEARR
ncbi:hypothetical protein AAHA92_32935 [Salvia divinorum]|uniref:Uncharacterized protein n=1 Tax=Salvia divinorum TaxID=28513 RepID=A0ABD1FMB7_SALDI